MKIYVVTANTYDCGYGAKISLFGVYSDEEKAQKRFYYVENVLGHNAKITETDMDEEVGSDYQKYLGGYIE